ncbi:hypothetical protein FE257_008860 [Aspergillus nanangensis]|uniref:Cytochrome P450 n=1 Tax=Aspergillus nanangensis TaxID=2582783 RepID=A0AAD4CKN6_ASPNN|nr:hypothetical protein FE257_008860 [Aspergillus nanangensis]
MVSIAVKTCVAALLFVVGYNWIYSCRKRPLPPGPKPVPLVGNALQIPKDAPWEKLHEWFTTYGPIISLKLGSRTVIVLGNRDVVHDLIQRRSRISSSRPRFIVFGEHYAKSRFPALLPYDSKWQSFHRIQSSILNPRNAKGYRPVHIAGCKQMLYRMLDGEHIVSHFSYFVSSAWSTMLYSTRAEPTTETTSDRIHDMLAHLTELFCIEHSLLDIFPVLEYTPGISWISKRKGEAFFKEMMTFFEARIRKGLQSASWNISQAWHQRLPAGTQWEDFAGMITEVEFAANSTLPVTLSIIAMMFALHPEETKKVQAEIDEQIGTQRLPTFEDAGKLPYTDAFLRECLRLQSNFPFALPRAVTQEEEYMGYRIPRDAIILPCQYALNMDETVFESPKAFRPQRWVDNPNLPSPATFGFPRRLCPGKSYAKDLMFIGMTSMAWGFNFEADNNVSERPSESYSLLYIPSVKTFRFSCRTAAHRAIIEREWQESETNVHSHHSPRSQVESMRG